jgi:hypothetical protein
MLFRELFELNLFKSNNAFDFEWKICDEGVCGVKDSR